MKPTSAVCYIGVLYTKLRLIKRKNSSLYPRNLLIIQICHSLSHIRDQRRRRRRRRKKKKKKKKCI
jgi:hypothetical protein